MFDALLPLLQTVANSTLPVINIPATLTPTFTPPTSAVATDPLGIIGLISMALAAFNTYQSRKNDSKQTERANAIADTQIDQAGSLKATDIGVKDLAMGVNMAVQKLADNPNNKPVLETQLPELSGKSIMEFIKTQKEGWDKDIRDYYQSLPPNPQEFSKDPVIAKTAAVKKMSEPNPTS